MKAVTAKTKNVREFQRRIDELQARLGEAEETLRAIREGEVDAVVVSGTKGEQIFSLVGSDSIYRLIVETMKGAAFTLTFDGTILFCNAQLGELVKCPMENVVGRRLDEFISETSRADASSFLLAAQKLPVKQRLVFRASDGARVSAHVASNLLNQPDGVSICVVANDLSELENSTELIQQMRRQQEALQAINVELVVYEEELRVQNEELSASRAELDRMRARYQDLFETAPDGYIVTDPKGSIQEVNQAAVQLLGCPAAELRGKPFSALLPETAMLADIQSLNSLIAGSKALPKWEVLLRRTQKSPFWASITARTSCDEQGRITGMRWLLRDITTRKNAEEELSRKAEELRRTNAELAYFNNAMVGRELRMIELKKEIDQLCRQFGQPPRYNYGGESIESSVQQA